MKCTHEWLPSNNTNVQCASVNWIKYESFKSSRGLGSMSGYSAQKLICFIAFIFQFSIPLWVWMANFQNCHHEHRAPCHCPLQSKWCCSSDNQISQHAFTRCSSMKTLSGNYATELVKLTDKLDEIFINGRFQYRSKVNGEFYWIPVSNCTVFQPRIWTNFRNVGIRWSQVVLKIQLGQEFDSCQTWVWKSCSGN